MNDGSEPFMLGIIIGFIIAILTATAIDDTPIQSNLFVDSTQTLCKANEGPKTIQTVTSFPRVLFKITCNNGAVFEVPLSEK